MTKPRKQIPEFANEAEERAFWELPKNDSTEYVDSGPKQSWFLSRNSGPLRKRSLCVCPKMF